MPNDDKTVAIAKTPLPIGPKGIQLESFEALWRFAQCIAASPFAPRGMEKPEAIVPAIQLGLEIGLSPMSALQNVAVINGRPGIYGDAALALVRASGLCEYYTQRFEGEGDDRRAIVVSKRTDSPEPIESIFSVKDAKRAGLWGKQGPWTQYPDRMLLFRARGFNLRDNFGDVLKGMSTLEELRDLNIKPVSGHTVENPDIRFDEPEESTTSETDTVARPAGDTHFPAKRKRRTKAEMEAEHVRAVTVDVPDGVPAEVPEAPPRATPLEGVRNLIAASPITEFQLEQRLIKNGVIEPTQNLGTLNDDELLQIQSMFMSIAAEIVDGQ